MIMSWSSGMTFAFHADVSNSNLALAALFYFDNFFHFWAPLGAKGSSLDHFGPIHGALRRSWDLHIHLGLQKLSRKALKKDLRKPAELSQIFHFTLFYVVKKCWKLNYSKFPRLKSKIKLLWSTHIKPVPPRPLPHPQVLTTIYNHFWLVWMFLKKLTLKGYKGGRGRKKWCVINLNLNPWACKCSPAHLSSWGDPKILLIILEMNLANFQSLVDIFEGISFVTKENSRIVDIQLNT